MRSSPQSYSIATDHSRRCRAGYLGAQWQPARRHHAQFIRLALGTPTAAGGLPDQLPVERRSKFRRWFGGLNVYRVRFTTADRLRRTPQNTPWRDDRCYWRHRLYDHLRYVHAWRAHHRFGWQHLRHPDGYRSKRFDVTARRRVELIHQALHHYHCRRSAAACHPRDAVRWGLRADCALWEPIAPRALTSAVAGAGHSYGRQADCPRRHDAQVPADTDAVVDCCHPGDHHRVADVRSAHIPFNSRSPMPTARGATNTFNLKVSALQPVEQHDQRQRRSTLQLPVPRARRTAAPPPHRS